MLPLFRALLRLLPLPALCLPVLLGFAAPSCAATTYYVSPSGSDSNAGTFAAPFLTIQHGINAAVSGDTVTVEDGTYTGPGDVDLDFGGRNLTVQSQNGAATTIIDCGGYASSDFSGQHRGFYLHSRETNAVINRLTIENGYEGPNGGGGGGILNYNTGVTIQNCVFTNDFASDGGGISNYESTYQNSSPNAAVVNCVFASNSANDGGGIFNHTDGGGAIMVINCTVTGNSASDGNSGGIYNAGGAINLVNDIVYSNTGGSIVSYAGATSGAAHCDIQGGVPSGTIDNGGNIDADPLLVNSPADLHPQPSSPCIGAGTATGAPTTDITGVPRPNPPSIGAYELNTILTVPSQYATIQAAINASVNGDTVLIADGTYTGLDNVDLDFGGKSITVISQHGAASTTIDCQGSNSVNHRGFYIHSGENSAAISGLTI